MVEDFEVMFVKQQATQGFQLIKAKEQDDHIYLLLKGKARIIASAKDLQAQGVLSDEIASQCPGHFILGKLKVGDIFG